jgi:3-hydroxybutyryl-CoA dehydrogenase
MAGAPHPEEPMEPSTLQTVAVIGNGIIGHGVTQVFAAAGRSVVMIGRDPASLARATERIAGSLADFVRHGLVDASAVPSILGRIRTSVRLEDAAPAQLVIEAVTEDLPLKVDLFGRLDAICAPPTVLASSSGQPASALVARVRHPERAIAAHFWYPPQLIPLVEVCPGPRTDPQVTAWTCAVLKAAGKEPALIEKEIPGFIGNRLQFAMLREAWALWASGVASAEAIDTVVRTSFGRRVAITGPLESADVGGLQTMVSFARSLLPHLDTGAAPAPAVQALADQGCDGLGNGRGVYDWSRRDGAALVRDRMDELFRWLKADRERRG